MRLETGRYLSFFVVNLIASFVGICVDESPRFTTRLTTKGGSASQLLRLQLNRELNRKLCRNPRGQIDKVHDKAYDKGNRPGTWDLRFSICGIRHLATGIWYPASSKLKPIRQSSRKDLDRQTSYENAGVPTTSTGGIP